MFDNEPVLCTNENSLFTRVFNIKCNLWLRLNPYTIQQAGNEKKINN